MGLLQATHCLRRPKEFCPTGSPNARHGGSTAPDANNLIVDDSRVQQAAAAELLKVPVCHLCHLH
jgi:hypothetical protein